VLVLAGIAAGSATGAPALTSRGFPTGQCTSWANIERPYIVDLAMLRLHTSDWNADAWAANASRAGFRVGAAPAAGAIAVWPANVDGAGVDGHVAYVERVFADGAFLVSETNVNGDPNVSRRVVQADRALRFIYRQPDEPVPVGRGELLGLSSGAFPSDGGPSTITVHLSGEARVLFRLTGPDAFVRESSLVLPGTTPVPVAALAPSAPAAGDYTLTADVVGGASYGEISFPLGESTEELPRQGSSASRGR
jgi:surface antigen